MVAHSRRSRAERRGSARAPRRAESPPRGPGPLARLDSALARGGGRAVAAMIAAYAAVFLIVAAVKLHFYLYKDFDLAIFAQAIDGLLHGTTFSSIRGMSWLGDHSSLILVPLAPLWAIAPHPFTLLAVQTLALALGAWPVHRMARRALPGGALPAAAAALYLLYPALGYSNLFEFHPETLATPALLATLEAFLEARLARTLFWSFVALLCREDVALPVLGLAVLALGGGRPRRGPFAAGLASLAIVSIGVTFAGLKPAFNSGEAEYGRMYAQWGATPLAALRHLATHPLQALAALWNTSGNAADTLEKRQYWLHLLLPLAGLPLLAPRLLLPAAPIVLEHMLSERTHQHTIYFQYTALVTPFAIAAAVGGLARIAARRRTAPAAARDTVAAGRAAGAAKPAPPGGGSAALALALGIVALAANACFGPLIGQRIFQRSTRNEAIVPPEYDRTLTPYRDRMLARVPRTGGVVAGFDFLSRLARRPAVYSLHHVVTGRYTYSNRVYPLPSGITALIADMAGQIPSTRLDSGRRLRRMIAENDLHPVDAASSTVLFLRGARDTLRLLDFAPPRPLASAAFVVDSQIAYFDADPLPDSVPEGGLLEVRTHWQRAGPVSRVYLAQMQVFHEGEFTRAKFGRNRPIGYGIWPVADWPADSSVTETFRLDVSTRIGPGRYYLAMMAVAMDSLGHPLPSSVSARAQVVNGQVVILGSFRVVPRPRR